MEGNPKVSNSDLAQSRAGQDNTHRHSARDRLAFARACLETGLLISSPEKRARSWAAKRSAGHSLLSGSKRKTRRIAAILRDFRLRPADSLCN